MQYKPVLALVLYEDPSYADLNMFIKEGETYHQIDYLNWHTEGTTWVGGTFDIVTHDKLEYEIDPYSYLYVVDQSTCGHSFEIRENGDLVEQVCSICGLRRPA